MICRIEQKSFQFLFEKLSVRDQSNVNGQAIPRLNTDSFIVIDILDFLPISTESRLCRPVGASNAYMPALTGNTYTPANEAADGPTWWRPSHKEREVRK